jgi:uncharacterized membrane protein
MRKWFPAAFIVAAVLFSIAVYSRLPDQVPTHWDISGEPDDFSSRARGAFMLPGIMLAVFVLMQWIPSLDPRASNIEKFRGSYDLVVGAMIAFLGVMHVLALGNALGWQVNMTKVVLICLGTLFVMLGNYLPRARSNFVFGIRTPWTLSSDAVWTRVHRIGGYATAVAGLITIATAFLELRLSLAIALPSLLLSALVPIVYSYVLWARERRGPSTDP